MQRKKPPKRKTNFIQRNFNQSIDYIKKSKNFIYIVTAVFSFFILVGYLFPAPDYISQTIIGFIKNLLLETGDLSQGELVSFIFFNNLQSSFFGMVLGIFLGIFPMITLIANGYLLGFVALKATEAEGIFVLWRLFPHGIFELPALLISLGLGLKLGSFILQEKKFESLKHNLIESLRAFVFIIIPLLLIAAIIEGSLIFLFK